MWPECEECPECGSDNIQWIDRWVEEHESRITRYICHDCDADWYMEWAIEDDEE